MGYQDPDPTHRKPKPEINEDLMLDEILEARANYYSGDGSYDLEEEKDEIVYQGKEYCLTFEIKHLK